MTQLLRRQAGRRLAILVGALMVLGVLGAVPAAADEAETHCVVAVIDVVDGEMITGPPVCAADPATAMARAVRGAWKLPADTRLGGGDVIETPLGSYFNLARHYDGYNGSGSSITVVGGTCNGSYWNTPSWWDNRISSTYNYCYRTRHYDNPNLGGSSSLKTGAFRYHNITGYMNNRTESVRYYSS